jgi:hypothetical protein
MRHKVGIVSACICIFAYLKKAYINLPYIWHAYALKPEKKIL